MQIVNFKELLIPILAAVVTIKFAKKEQYTWRIFLIKTFLVGKKDNINIKNKNKISFEHGSLNDSLQIFL